jgi:hypothetical protein
MTAAIGTELRGSPDTATRYATIHLNRGAAPSGLGAQVTAIVDPVCQTTSDPAQPDLLGLHLYHPDLGWLSFAFTRTAARTLGDLLMAHAPDHKEIT